MNKYIILIITATVILSSKVIAQTNSLSSSPYSLYGLGVSNEVSTGKVNGLDGLAIAMPSNTFINSSNPASFGAVPLNSFFFDFGLKAETNTLAEGGSSNSNIIANFSNIAFAFPVTKHSGFGVTLIPLTSVGYTISNIKSNIEGSENGYFLTDITGNGGINDLKLNYGYSITNNFRLGITGSALFGKIEQTETDYLPANSLIIEDVSNYSGFRLGAGLQYDFLKTVAFGATVNLPVSLNGSKESTVNLYDADGNTDLSETYEKDIDAFKLPLEYALGLKTTFKKYLNLNLDYKKSLWSETNQSDQLGNYVDQDVFGFGLEYAADKKPGKFFKNMEYRAGYKFSNGNLEVNDYRIKNSTFNFGLGIPFNNGTSSMLNIGYTYGSKGQITNGLIKEHYHLLSINLSLEGIWFQKSKFY